MAERDAEINAVIARMTEAFNRGDFDEVAAIAHPEGELARSWDKTPLRGREALRQWLEPVSYTHLTLPTILRV